MAKGKIIGGKSMSYSDALRILGFKTTPTIEQLKKRYRDLAKKYHPDISKELNAIDKFKQIGQAIKTIKEKKEPTKYANKELGPYYQMIMQQLPREPTLNDIDKAYAKLIRIPKFRQSITESEKLRLAKELVDQIAEDRQWFANKQRARVKSAIRRTLLLPEEREFIEMQKKIRLSMLKYTTQRLISRLRKMIKRSKLIKGRFKIPILIKGKKPYIKWITITTSLIIAIMGGKYLYDKIRKAYVPRKIIGLITTR